jgi:hypothetical protein
MSVNIPAQLPNIADARLPATYESAKQALAECSRIDECQSWADKAAALASYARQARDDTLLSFATRIKARALDRCGELLRQIPASSGGRPETKDAADLSLSPRQQAAHNAHLSERQRKTAMRINSIPRERFEALVESENPPTSTQLAEMGKKKRQRPLRDLGDRSPDECAASTALTEIIEDFARASARVDILHALRRCEKAELERQLASVRSTSEWLKDLLGDDEPPDGPVGHRAGRISGVIDALAKLPAENQRSLAETAKRGEQVSAVTAFNTCDPEASKTSDGTGKEAEPAPTLNPQAWSLSTPKDREAFVREVGVHDIEAVIKAAQPGLRGSDAIKQAWNAATFWERLPFVKEFHREIKEAGFYVGGIDAWNR